MLRQSALLQVPFIRALLNCIREAGAVLPAITSRTASTFQLNSLSAAIRGSKTYKEHFNLSLLASKTESSQHNSVPAPSQDKLGGVRQEGHPVQKWRG